MRISFLSRKYYICLLVLCFWVVSTAQHLEEKTKDSLVGKLKNQKGKKRLTTLKYLCEEFHSKDPKLVLKYIDQGLKLTEKYNDETTRLTFQRLKGISHSVLGNMKDALQSLNSAMTNATYLNDTVQIAKTAHSLGNYHNRIGNYKKAETQYLKAKVLASKTGILKTKYLAEFNLATLYINRGLHKKANVIYDALLNKCPNDNIDCNAALLNKAICVYMLGEPSKGLDMLFDAKTIDEANDYQFRVQYINHHIAYVLESVELFEEAIVYYNEVLVYFNEQGDLKQQAAVNGTIGGLLMKLNRNEQAKIYLQKSLELQRENGLMPSGRIHTSLGDLALVNKNFKDATTHYEKASSLLRETKDKRGTGLLWLSKADFSIAKKNYKKAEARARSALNLARELSLKQLQIDACKRLASILEKQERFEEAIIVRDRLKELNIGVADKQTALVINQKLVQNELIKNEKKIAYLESLVKNENISKIRISIILTIFFLVVLGSILYLNRKKFWKSRFVKHLVVFDENEAQKLIASLDGVMQTQQPFLNENLNLLQLAALLPTTQKKLSILLNKHLNTNFYDYINAYRIAEAKEMFQHKMYNSYSIEGISEECGFKSKSSFYRIFKKETGQSPGAFRKNILEKKVS